MTRESVVTDRATDLASAPSIPGMVAPERPVVDVAVVLPTPLGKQDLVNAALKTHGAGVTNQHLECAPGYDLAKHLESDPNHPYYREKIMPAYKDRGRAPCVGPLTISRLQKYLEDTCSNSDGGSRQCPEIVEWYSGIAAQMRPGSIFCDVGFFRGSSSAAFLLGGRPQGVVVHAFDRAFQQSSVALLRELFGPSRFIVHEGELESTVSAFVASGSRCDVVFLDAVHPLDMQLFRSAAKPGTLVAYHWHFRTSSSIQYFSDALARGTFKEHGCMKTWCTLTPDPTSKPIVRESCLGEYLGV